MSAIARNNKEGKRQILMRQIKRYMPLYILLILPLAYLIVLRFYPMVAQFVISFSRYKIKGGIWNSPKVG